MVKNTMTALVWFGATALLHGKALAVLPTMAFAPLVQTYTVKKENNVLVIFRK